MARDAQDRGLLMPETGMEEQFQDGEPRLFRKDAIEAQQTTWLGNVFLARPASFLVVTLSAAGIAALLIAFFAFGSYTRRTTVSGQLVPDVGLVKLYPPQAATVISKNVEEGEQVRKGQILYVLSGERLSGTGGKTQAAISQQVGVRLQSLRDELKKSYALEQAEVRAIAARIGGFNAELAKIDTLLEQQKRRVVLSAEVEQRSRDLQGKGYISKDQLVERQIALLDQQGRLEALERDRIATARQLNEQTEQQLQLRLKYGNQRAELERAVASAEQELYESEVRREAAIVAATSGVAAAVSGEIGQRVDQNKPLVSIVPSDASMQVHLYAPSRAMGFVKAGDKVMVRVQAYPYQKFGQLPGVVEDVSHTALSSVELTGSDAFARATSDGSAQPLYRIVVRLSSQTVTAYGKPQTLQAGMLVEADILNENRRLYEWVLEPLYTISGKL